MINLSECAVIVVVALCAFGPRRLPMLIKHVAVAMRWLTHSKTYLTQEIDRHLSIIQLEESRQKADQADRLYSQQLSFRQGKTEQATGVYKVVHEDGARGFNTTENSSAKSIYVPQPQQEESSE